MSVEGMWEAAWGYWMPGMAWPGLAELASGAAGTRGHIHAEAGAGARGTLAIKM